MAYRLLARYVVLAAVSTVYSTFRVGAEQSLVILTFDLLHWIELMARSSVTNTFCGLRRSLKLCLHDTICCQTGLTTSCIVHTAGCQTGCTTGCIA